MSEIHANTVIFNLLPSEIKHEILKHTTWKCVLTLRLTCHTWNSIVNIFLFASFNPNFRLASSHWYRTPDPSVTIYPEENAESILAGKLKKYLQIHVAENRPFNLAVSPGYRNGGCVLDRGEWLKNRKKQTRELVNELDINYVKYKWKPPLQNHTQIHRLVGWLYVPNAGEFEIQLHPELEKLPGLLKTSGSTTTATILEVPKWVESEAENKMPDDLPQQTADREERQFEETDLPSSFAQFLSDSFFQPPIHSSIPVRIRWYHLSKSPRYPACRTSRSYEAIKFFLSPGSRLSPTASSQSSQSNYITISDIILALDEQLATFMAWDNLYMIKKFNFYINTGGWLDITLIVDSLGSKTFNESEHDDTSEYDSDVYENLRENEDIVVDSTNVVTIKGKDKRQKKGIAEDVDELFEG